MRLFRDLGRRKLRSTLTITGIAIGIMALVVFGSMANKMNALIDGGVVLKTAIVSIGNMYTGSFQPLSLGDIQKIEAIEGVAVATPTVDMMLSDEGGATMGVPEMISAAVAGGDKGLETFTTTIAQGRQLTADDEGQYVTVLGCDLARRFDAKIGGTVQLRGIDFTVVGILAPTLTAPDKAAMVPLAAGQELFVKTLPMIGPWSTPPTSPPASPSP
jgi:ABC-type lipoprotein release transport system permease subunit